MAQIEFYDGNRPHPFASVESDAVPREGEAVSISGEPWMVIRVTWALDHSDDPRRKVLRANVEMDRLPK